MGGKPGDLAEERAKELLARRLLARGKMAEAEIAEDTGLSLETVRGLAGLQPT